MATPKAEKPRKTRGQPMELRKRAEVDAPTSPLHAYSASEATAVLLPEPDRKLYKFLQRNGLSPYQHTRWPLPTKNPDGSWTPGEWFIEPGKLVTCVYGLHLAFIDESTPQNRRFAGNWVNDRVFEVEVEGPVLFSKQQQKFVAGKVRLTREVEGWDAFQNAPYRDQLTDAEHNLIQQARNERYFTMIIDELRKRGFNDLADRVTIENRRAVILELQRQLDIEKAEWRVREAQRWLEWLKDPEKDKDYFVPRRFKLSPEDKVINAQLRIIGASLTPEAVADMRAGITGSYSEAAYRKRRQPAYVGFVAAENGRWTEMRGDLHRARAARPIPTFDALFPPDPRINTREF